MIDPDAPEPAKPVPLLTLPEDSIVLPYSGTVAGNYEHGFAKFAHMLETSDRSGPANSEMLDHYASRDKRGYYLRILRWPIVAWNLDTNRTSICKALILVDSNKSKRKDVWSSDNVAMAVNMFNSCT